MQLYIRHLATQARRPDRELRSFARVELEPDQEGEVLLELVPRDFAVYDPRREAWVIPTGEVEILVGSSSSHLPLRRTLEVRPAEPLSPLLDRSSLISDWLADPRGKELVEPVLGGLLFGAAASGVDPEGIESLRHLLEGVPLGRLVGMSRGLFGEEALANIEAAVKQ